MAAIQNVEAETAAMINEFKEVNKKFQFAV